MDHSFFLFLRNSVNSFISICLSDLKDQKLPVSAIKTRIEDNRPKILLARRAHKWSRQLACSNYGPNRAIGTSANVKTWFLRNYFKIWPAVSENKIFLRISSCLYSAKAPIHQSHIYRQIKILRTGFEKGHPRNIPVKLFQNLTNSFGEKSFIRISSCPYCAKKKKTFTRAIFIDRSIFCEHFLKRVTQGTFLWNYFKIWPAVSKKIF